MKMLIIAMALAAAQPDARSAKLRESIRHFCKSNPQCIERQQKGVRNFLGVMFMHEVPDSQSEKCMRLAKVGKALDWSVAASCMHKWSAGRRTILGTVNAPR